MGPPPPAGSRIEKEEVLDNHRRGVIYTIIVQNPGVGYTELRDFFCHLPQGSLSYHLKILEREGYVHGKIEGRRHRFYPAGIRIPDEPELGVTQQDILVAVREKPGIFQDEIPDEVGVVGSTVSYHLRNLARMGLLVVKRRGRQNTVYPVED